jgi:hypothetical protein
MSDFLSLIPVGHGADLIDSDITKFMIISIRIV